MTIQCDVYRSGKKENLYLYVAAEDGLARVPEELLTQFGTPEKALSFELTADRQLAHEDAPTVIANIAEKGFHLQLPPADGTFSW